MDFAVPEDHRVKLKESEKKDKFHDLAWELKKKVTVIAIVIGALATVTSEKPSDNTDVKNSQKRNNNNQYNTKNNYIKAWIDKTQNSKCRLWGGRDETITYIIRECSKLAEKEYKTGHDKVGRRSTRNFARSLNLTIRTSGIY